MSRGTKRTAAAAIEAEPERKRRRTTGRQAKQIGPDIERYISSFLDPCEQVMAPNWQGCYGGQDFSGKHEYMNPLTRERRTVECIRPCFIRILQDMSTENQKFIQVEETKSGNDLGLTVPLYQQWVSLETKVKEAKLPLDTTLIVYAREMPDIPGDWHRIDLGSQFFVPFTRRWRGQLPPSVYTVLLKNVQGNIVYSIEQELQNLIRYLQSREQDVPNRTMSIQVKIANYYHTKTLPEGTVVDFDALASQGYKVFQSKQSGLFIGKENTITWQRPI